MRIHPACLRHAILASTLPGNSRSPHAIYVAGCAAVLAVLGYMVL